MTALKIASINTHEELSLAQLCELVIAMSVGFRDVSEFIENRTYALCIDGKCKAATGALRRVAAFFVAMKNKNEEDRRDLADIYILIGEVNQYVGCFRQSIGWFKKACSVFGRYAMPYHNLATSYLELGDIMNAVRCLEQEIALEPGNYFSRLKLADLYEQRGDFEKEEASLEDLLSRDPDNIQALHKLITHYETQQPHVDVELLRKRLTFINKKFNEIEIVIKAYHLCREKQFAEALDFLDARRADNSTMTMLSLLKAHVLGELRQFSKKRRELTAFKQNCHGKTEYMKNKLDEFEHVFGKKAVARLGKILVVVNPNART
jgi:tetratricopeptide (TPR) repeat protein